MNDIEKEMVRLNTQFEYIEKQLLEKNEETRKIVQDNKTEILTKMKENDEYQKRRFDQLVEENKSFLSSIKEENRQALESIKLDNKHSAESAKLENEKGFNKIENQIDKLKLAISEQNDTKNQITGAAKFAKFIFGSVIITAITVGISVYKAFFSN